MTANTTDRQAGWIVLGIVAALFVVPAFTMRFGMMGTGSMMGGHHDHGMWGANDGASDWMFVIGAGLQLLFLALLVGAGYLGYSRLTSGSESADPALEELRTAYARGDIDDEEFERRRERLESSR